MKNFISAIGIIGAMATIGAIACTPEETKQEAFVPTEEKAQLIIFEEPLFIQGRVQHLDFTNEEPMIIIVKLKEKK